MEKEDRLYLIIIGVAAVVAWLVMKASPSNAS